MSIWLWPPANRACIPDRSGLSDPIDALHFRSSRAKSRDERDFVDSIPVRKTLAQRGEPDSANLEVEAHHWLLADPG
jgi:hypothetical protein